MTKLKKKFEHYWMCMSCGMDMGGVFPEDHTCTVTRGACPYCKAEKVTLIPWVDFDWPKDESLSRAAKMGRD